MSGSDSHCPKATRASGTGPYGTPAYKVPAAKKNKGLAGAGGGRGYDPTMPTMTMTTVATATTSSMSPLSEDLTDTAWPLEKTLPKPSGVSVSRNFHRPSVKGDEILKTDPGSLTRQSINMIYTPIPAQLPDQPTPPPPQSCLQRDIHARVGEGEEALPCQVCGVPIPIPDRSQPKSSWAKQFPTDVFLSHLQEAVKQLEGRQPCCVCRSRQRTTQATHYCFDCASCYCTGCTEQHRHMPTHGSHRVKAMVEVTASDLMKHRKRFCSSHPGLPLDLFCLEHEEPMCQQCAMTVHQACGSITTVVKIATEKKGRLKDAEKFLETGISKCEDTKKRLQTETAEIEQLKQQTMAEVDGSFTQVIRALEKRRSKLKRDIDEHFSADAPQFQQTRDDCDTLMKSMKTRMDLLTQMIQHGSDFDILSCADSAFRSAESMAARQTVVAETPRPKVIVKMDDRAVHNFVELVSLLGAEVGSTQVRGILLKKITTKMKGDQHSPDVRDILLAADNHVVAIDNRNKCVKAILIDGDTFLTKRLQLKSEPWGGTKLQPSMMAVTGLKVIYIITITDQLALQSTVRTRKDYWGVCAISPINLACSCKYPPGVDIVDITGRRLRSIEVNPQGEQLFEMPGYVAMNGDNILVTDRAKKCLTCVDQEGKVVFVYRGQGDERLEFPRGICVDRKGRIFVADHDRNCVHLLSGRGEYLCQVMSVPKPRTLCLDHNDRTIYLSNEGKGITFFNLIEVET
ncbi:uncharacterized protein LOC143292327 [Babylonia areolata]|uniref:uncharacterized protein LOC143292327 n=1 Tax=Babylonia areolata TaxID=304850 RepID=UPI003FCFFB54